MAINLHREYELFQQNEFFSRAFLSQASLVTRLFFFFLSSPLTVSLNQAMDFHDSARSLGTGQKFDWGGGGGLVQTWELFGKLFGKRI